MNLGWKEIKRNKIRFVILGSIVFLVSLLTFMISGLANGLSQDNAALIKNLPDGTLYLEAEAEGNYSFSSIDSEFQEDLLAMSDEVTAFSIQMGFVDDQDDKQHSVAFVTSTASDDFAHADHGEVILDQSLKEDGIAVGDILTNQQFDGELEVVGFVEESKFSHAPVAYINIQDYQDMYRTESLQILYTPEEQAAINTEHLQAYSPAEFLNTIPSYQAEQLSLNMIIWFLVVISGMLFGIFFYMMNVQKIGLYGILKAVGVKTSALFKMIWLQMLLITIIALAFSISLSHLFNLFAPAGMPFHLTAITTIQLSVIFLIIGFAGATISGFQIKKAEPLQAIQQGES
ncbi:ABC transporter permease [Gracilibacillus alcaliphilus]|uniref:ABC transporter permease n=1 Tax=Gracilibacillus alcaliphilus TaxID=1401441 RepID=UPI001957F1C8|nr:ABC transporter permease [Gracilibacillus alcaliphilus]MBM7676277.1 putative ABC transport system permease protein [Gracilibacillus alcaliphilus]